MTRNDRQDAHIYTFGDPKLLLPALVNEGLASNDRAKFYFSPLPMAQAHADDPQRRTPELVAERNAAGVDEDMLDALSNHGGRLGPGRYCIPDIMTLCPRLSSELSAMLEHLRIAKVDTADDFSSRLTALLGEPWCSDHDAISAAQIARLTSGSRERGDSAHLLVMDLHKAPNALQVGVASENVDGAAAHEI